MRYHTSYHLSKASPSFIVRLCGRADQRNDPLNCNAGYVETDAICHWLAPHTYGAALRYVLHCGTLCTHYNIQTQFHQTPCMLQLKSLILQIRQIKYFPCLLTSHVQKYNEIQFMQHAFPFILNNLRHNNRETIVITSK